MCLRTRWIFRTCVLVGCFSLAVALLAQNKSLIGKEISIPRHLQNGEEYELSMARLISFGQKLFEAKWTIQEGEGRPLSKGTGSSTPTLSDPTNPLVFPRNFNRISGPDSNSCSGCHNEPYVGGGGDRVTEVFVEGNRFDFATFDHSDGIVTDGAVAENGQFVTLQDIADERKTISMNGSGFIEMLARQMTGQLQVERNALKPGQSVALTATGVNFGTLARNGDGTWDTSKVQGITALSLGSTGADNPPTLIIMPFQQASSVVSLRQFTNNAFNQHHGIQSEERFGLGVDEDGDGFVNELTRADMTAVTIFQATLPVPGQIIPDDPDVQAAVANGQKLFTQVGCATCHVPALPLSNKGWIYSEPNPYNPAGNLQTGQAPQLAVDLTSDELPGPRLKPDQNGIVWVPAYTDLKIHDICLPNNDPNGEALNQNVATTSPAFADGNRSFVTRKLWGFANEGPFMHHGKFTTIRQAIGAHNGEAAASQAAFNALSEYDRDSIIEFLKTLKVLPPGSRSLVMYQHYSDFN
jgi:Di-haem oxidoreductase, putative peroxidase